MSTTLHTTTARPLSTPGMARAAGVEEWHLRAAIRRGFIEAPAKVGPMMLWSADDLPRVRAALVAAGYLPAEAGAADKPE